MEKSFRYSVIGLLFLITIAMQMYLVEAYPYTGLGRIVMIPFVIILVLICSIVLNLLLKEMKQDWKALLLCGLSVLIVVLLNIFLWPQDGGPSTWEQVFYGEKRGE